MRAAPRAAAMALTLAGGCLAAIESASAVGAPNVYCAAIAEATDAFGRGSGPTFVLSYQPGPGERRLPGPISTSAFSYDNALAAIALVACGDTPRAKRIADAFVFAAAHDRIFKDGRIRNAYRAGPVSAGAVNLPGWWDAQANRWDEDAYQDGSATGNVAWVALALLHLHAATGRAEYLATASTLLAWIGANTATAPGPAGYAGGVSGFDDAQEVLSWKSTEHNIDIAAAATWAQIFTHAPTDTEMARKATSFVASRFLPGPGYFILGTRPDGSDADVSQLALDVQLWPTLGIPDAPAAWRRALGFADHQLRRGDGMTFAGIGPNRWTEGTAQAALTFRYVGANAIADSLLDSLPAHASPSGLLYATSAGEVATGLALEAKGGGAFNYYHRPHLGATAWAALAAERWNPFIGKRMGP